MRSLSLPLVLLVLLGLFSAGASCDNGQDAKRSKEPAAAAATKQPEKPAKIEKLERIDTSALTDPERRTFVDVVNEVLSPCGEPISVARCVAESRGCSACVPGARYLVRLVAEGYEKAEIQDLFTTRFDPKQKVKIDVASAPVRGEPMAKVTIVEFSDFECPHCGAAHPLLARVLEEFGGKVNLVFKHFPLDSHKNAAPAARAAVAAQAQGKFWEYADQLFEHQRELTPEKLRELAKRVGLDLTKFDADFNGATAKDRVEKDKKDGTALGVQGTPSLYVNGRPFKESLTSLSKYLKEELAL